jgi:BolA protein
LTILEQIRGKLERAFAPSALSVVDQSHLHKGHAGARPGGESHFRVEIVATAFEGLSRVQRHRAVNRALAEELAGRVHALAISAQTPAEAARRA